MEGGRGGPDIRAAARVLFVRLGSPPEVLLVLGSGLGHVADAVTDPLMVPFHELPGWPAAMVSGHAGRYVAGRLEERQVLVQQGRFHVYEGHALDLVVAPIRVAHALGIRSVILTNAAGGIHRALAPGSLVVLDDHLDLQFRSPLAGPARVGEARFVDLARPYDASLQALALDAARDQDVPLHRGVYAALSGPSYETPAEVRMLERMGADVVGMSTVPEVLVARALGMRCLAFSLVTNPAAGLGALRLSHEEVMEAGQEAGRRLGGIVRVVLRDMAP